MHQEGSAECVPLTPTARFSIAWISHEAWGPSRGGAHRLTLLVASRGNLNHAIERMLGEPAVLAPLEMLIRLHRIGVNA